MKKIEKIIISIVTMGIGVLLIALRGNFIGILMTVFGISLIALGVLDIVHNMIPPAVVKIVTGGIIILCGWLLFQAVLYIVAALLLTAGILLLYDKIKKRISCNIWYLTALEYAVPALMIVIGALFLFHQAGIIDFIFITCGIFTIVEGGIVLANAFLEE